MVLDLDDFCDDKDSLEALRLLSRLRDIRPDFRCTLFAIPGRCTPKMLNTLPDWVELAVHGWMHPSPHECEDWTEWQMEDVQEDPLVQEFFVHGFKAPGWQISFGCYQALLERDWWVADQPYNNHRRPKSLRCHLLGSPDHWHGHVGNVCGNGIQETYAQVEALVREAESFEFMSEAVSVHQPV